MNLSLNSNSTNKTNTFLNIREKNNSKDNKNKLEKEVNKIIIIIKLLTCYLLFILYYLK